MGLYKVVKDFWWAYFWGAYIRVREGLSQPYMAESASG